MISDFNPAYNFVRYLVTRICVNITLQNICQTTKFRTATHFEYAVYDERIDVGRYLGSRIGFRKLVPVLSRLLGLDTCCCRPVLTSRYLLKKINPAELAIHSNMMTRVIRFCILRTNDYEARKI